MKKAIMLAFPIVLMIILTFYFGVKVNNSKYKEFNESGYIISKTYNNQGDYVKSERYYFNEQTKYKSSINDEVAFKNVDDEDIKVKKNSFIHYDNGDLQVLKKSAILNLDTIVPDRTILYYSLSDKIILKNQKNIYSIKSAEKEMKLANFIVKIDENKYLLVASKMILTIGKEVRNLENTYFEIEFFEGDIVRIENNEVSFQSVLNDVYFQFENELKLDLNNKFISKEKKNIVNLNEMTIDSDDNIEIIEEEEVESGEEEDRKNPLTGMGNGIINSGNADSNDEEVNENQKEIDPIFTMTEMNVTSNKLQAEVQIIDSSNLLFDDISIKLLETTTNKVIYSTKENEGTMNLNIEIETLMPETNYVLIVNSAYRKGGNEYARDFIQKNILTESVGVTIKKDYFSLDSLAFKAVRKGYSNLNSITLTLLDSVNRVVSSQKLSFNGVEELYFSFEGLENNTEYKLNISEYLYSDSVITDTFVKDKKYKTLKQKPLLGDPAFLIDKKNSLFTLKLASSVDPDNGISSFKYYIYDARDLEKDPVQVIEKNNKASVDINVDDINILRGVPYTFKIAAVFNDNEKEYEYQTGLSEVMKMDGVTHPHITFDNEEITFERIKGNINIIDDGGTVSLEGNDLITVIYTDSTGVQNSFTSSGSLNIPFDENYLRKNETYTISVYAKIDLQDGNPPIDNAFLGSVVVKTKDTDALYLDHEVDRDNTDTAFRINARLTNYDGNDVELETDTMTGLVFNLYEGKNTTGRLVKNMRKVDRNLAEYDSELKDEFYNSEFQISPSFFGIRNEDLKAEYYTIEVVKAYDYTTYENKIEIVNNTITTKSVEFAPSLPDDVEDTIDIKQIRNKDAGEKYRADLKPETIVGYQLRARYDNSSKFAKTIKYNIIDAKTNNTSETVEYKVNDDGSIDYATIWIEDGTPYNEVDSDFRRGNEYYFTYEAELDMDFDGTVDKIYPTKESGIVLSSLIQIPYKQSPIIKMYPKISDEATFTWKYKITDVDNAMTQKNLFYNIDTELENQVPILTDETNYRDVQFTGLSKGILDVKYEECLIKKEENIRKNNLIHQQFESVYIPVPINYEVYKEVNRLVITFPNYSANNFFDKVAGAKVTFTSGSKTIVKDHLLIDSGNIIIDFTEIEELINQVISFKVELYYDSGIMGYESNSTVSALQIVDDGKSDNRGHYYYNNTVASFQTSASPIGSLFNVNLLANNTQLKIDNLATATSITLDVAQLDNGISYNYENLVPKKLKTIEGINNSSSTFTFDKIIPSISILNDNGTLDISPKLMSVKYKLELFGHTGDRIKDNKIYIEVYETNEEGTASEKINTTKFDLSELDEIIETDGLIPKTNYYAKFFAYVKEGESYVYEQLYDADFKTNTKNYYFQSLGDVGITNIKVEYQASSYQDRELALSYSLRETIGYDRIEYEIYKMIENPDKTFTEELVELDIEQDKIFKPEMEKIISIPPGCGVETTSEYRIYIRPYSTTEIDGQQEDIELVPNNDKIFKIGKLGMPFVGISSAVINDTDIKFKVSFYDKNKTVEGANYTVQFYDEENNMIETNYNDNNFTTNATHSFLLEGLEENKRYKIKVLYEVNLINGIDTLQRLEKNYTSTIIPTSGISIGDVSVIADPNNLSKVRLLFNDSYKLSEIDKIVYTIYDDVGYSFGKTESFLPITAPLESGITYHYFTLNTVLPDIGKYYFAIQFYKDGQIIAEESKEYDLVQ